MAPARNAAGASALAGENDLDSFYGSNPKVAARRTDVDRDATE